MKRISLAIGLVLLCSGQMLYGQNFIYTAPDSEKTANPGQLTQFYSEIQNLEAYEVTFWVVMDTTNKPPGWNVQFCTGLTCWPPWITLDSNAVIPGGGMDSILVDIYPDSSASEGWITMTVHPAGHPELAQAITFHAFLPGGVGEEASVPAKYELPEVYPNPFNASAVLTFSLQASGSVELTVLDLAGRQVERLYQGMLNAGEHRFIWKPGGNATGIYLARLEVEGESLIKKVVYLR